MTSVSNSVRKLIYNSLAHIPIYMQSANETCLKLASTPISKADRREGCRILLTRNFCRENIHSLYMYNESILSLPSLSHDLFQMNRRALKGFLADSNGVYLHSSGPILIYIMMPRYNELMMQQVYYIQYIKWRNHLFNSFHGDFCILSA